MPGADLAHGDDQQMDFMDIVADAVKKAAPALIGQLRYPPIRALCAVRY